MRTLALLAVTGALAASAAAATFTVDSVGDEPDANPTDGTCQTALGTCTLRAAIEQANATPGPDRIAFNIPGSGVHTISPVSFLPPLTDDAGVTIDGYTQPGASPNTLAVGDDAVLLIEIDGSATPSGFTGMLTINSSRNAIRGLVINRYLVAECVAIFGNDNIVEGNFLGTDPTGTVPRSCRGALFVGAPGNLIGGPQPASRNVLIAESLNVVDLAGLGSNVLQGNYVGTDRTGTLAMGSPFHGVAIEGDGNSVGGDFLGAGNLISGNGAFSGDGVIVVSSNNMIAGNFIGTDASGQSQLPNGGYGIKIDENTAGNTIRGNRIAFNVLAGVKVGTSSAAPTSANTISANSIFSNGGLGIDLGDEGLTPNDPCDSDVGANDLQNFPFLSSAVLGTGLTSVEGVLDSAAHATYRIEFFSNAVCDRTGYGQGQTFLGSALITTDASCRARFRVSLPITVPTGAFITATATDPAGNTSEFSACRPVTTGTNFYTVTPCRVADTRGPAGPYGAPSLMTASDRSFPVAGQCGIPGDATAVAFNFTVTNSSAAGDVEVFPGGTPLPVPPTLIYSASQTRAKNAVLALGTAGDIGTHVDQPSGSVDFVIDLTGYFR